MDTIFELFAALNTAIDAGAMTQEVVAFAALATSHRVLSYWNTGRISQDQLYRVSREMESLNQRWQLFRANQRAYAVPALRQQPIVTDRPNWGATI